MGGGQHLQNILIMKTAANSFAPRDILNKAQRVFAIAIIATFYDEQHPFQ